MHVLPVGRKKTEYKTIVISFMKFMKETGHVLSRKDILICLYKVRGQVVNGIMREKILLTGQKIIVFIFQQTEQCYCWKIRKDLQGCLQRREYIMY